jgi:hypothetical protein
MNNRKMQYWVIPPEADAEFVAHMEDVLETYAKPYDPDVPVVCMDEQPVQLVNDVKVPIAATKAHPRRVDYEYERAGVANVFMFTGPLSGWREVMIREKKTKADWVITMAELLLHPQAWQLAKHCPERIKQHDATERSGTSYPRHCNASNRNGSLGVRRECNPTRRRLADED